MRLPIAALIVFLSSGALMASDLENAARSGYGAIEKTQVNGDYQGCDFNRQIPLMDGLIFQCMSYSYHYAFMPEVLILKHVTNGSLKVLIDGEEVTGTLYKTN